MSAVIRRWQRANGLVLGVYARVFVAWEAASSTLRVRAYLLPPPSAILARLSQNPERLVGHFATTLQEVLLGFALGVAVSLPLGVLLVYSRPLERIVYPARVAFQAVPAAWEQTLQLLQDAAVIDKQLPLETCMTNAFVGA